MRTLPENPFTLDAASLSYQELFGELARMPLHPSYLSYNLTVSHESRFAWFRVAKVATRTIFSHLNESGATLDADHAMNVRYPLAEYESYFKFAFIRNPWDRLVSCWKDKVVNYDYFEFGDEAREALLEFPAFVRHLRSLDLDHCDQHLRRQCRLIDLNMLDFIGRVENFSYDFNWVCRKLSLPAYEGDVKTHLAELIFGTTTAMKPKILWAICIRRTSQCSAILLTV